MKSGIVLVLVVGSVLAAPPVRLMAKPQPDSYAHIFAQVRPAAQHNLVDMEIKEHRPETQHHIELEIKPVEEKQSQHIELALTADNLLKLPSHEIDLEIVQNQHQKQDQDQNHHLVDIQVKELQPDNQHHVELKVKPVEEKKQSQHIELDLTADNHSKQPSHEIELEIVQHQHQNQEDAQKHHLVDIEIKDHQPDIHHVELEGKPVEEKKQSQHIELELTADNHSKQPSREIELEIVKHQPQTSEHHFELEIIGEGSQVPQPAHFIHPSIPKPAFPNPQQSHVQHLHLGPAHL